MGTEPDTTDDDREQAREEVARVAKQLAEYGFYVIGALLPDEPRTKPSQPANRVN